eukprot:TRINITY_DN6804_c1_g3_i2.p2 TRINITY_DN6804_c1_g3~~TRINITY_DN6804_c1_g3_i2.p2  ORF type:complete len:178 (+),score=62.08 TRINITY_DN6804_c1_g3_i2:133-666(+)
MTSNPKSKKEKKQTTLSFAPKKTAGKKQRNVKVLESKSSNDFKKDKELEIQKSNVRKIQLKKTRIALSPEDAEKTNVIGGGSDSGVKKENIAHVESIVKAPKMESVELGEQAVEMLKQFDLEVKFGPCLGVTRRERWNRAEKNGLNPPQEVWELLDSVDEDSQFNLCLWENVKTSNE